MASNRSKLPPPAPRTIDVQKFSESRGSDLQSLQSIVATRLNNDFRTQRNSRRRTTGHDNRLANKKNGRKRKRTSSSLLGQVSVAEDGERKRKLSRRVRRRMELKGNPEMGFCRSGDGTKRLRTHVWHAKRFTMTKLWGFHLPLGLQGSGRGSRALLKWYKDGAVVHDASYYTCVELEGLDVALLSVLKMVLVPSPETKSDDDCPLRSGRICGKAMLHHISGSSPQAIGPVTYMWRPNQLDKPCLNSVCRDSNTSSESDCTEPQPSYRKLWMWLHPSAYDEGLEALKLACKKQINDTGHVVTWSSLEGKLAKLEVMGSKASRLLQKILQIADGSDYPGQLNGCLVLKPCAERHRMMPFNFEDVDDLASHSVISLIAKDPRNLSVATRVAISGSNLSIPTLSNAPESEDHRQSVCKQVLNKCETFKISSSEPAGDSLTGNILWDAKYEVRPPMNEHDVSAEKHALRLTSYSLVHVNSTTSNDMAELKHSRSCPIILIKNANYKSSNTGWSIILPLSWVRTFWIPLILNGAHAIGVREKHWIASELGLPFFPWDFPDCNAYTSLKASEAANFNEEAERRPLSVRPIPVPIPSPWNCVQSALDVDFAKINDADSYKEMHDGVVARGCLSVISDSTDARIAQQDAAAAQFDGIVARTSSMLSCYTNTNNGQNIPLVPFSTNKIRLSEWVLDKNTSKTHGEVAELFNKDRNLCFVRVALYAYREGVFEEGAVVCAPRSGDILSLKSSSDDNVERPHLPQSLVSSYFIEQTPGSWALQMPEDPALHASHRWPIGFVTTGFTRGSKEASASAICEAGLLGRLRLEQWKDMPAKKRKKEIYVLVRNLRSSAYRLATARIVLEHQEEDIYFM